MLRNNSEEPFLDAAFIGQRMRARREHLKLTQNDLAEGLSIARATYSRYESGDIAVSSPDLKRIARLLGVGIGYFYGEEEESNANEIVYEPILDELRTAGYNGGLDAGDVEEIAEIIRMKAKRRAKKQGRD